ncbi:MAG TPA: hypothetical protein VEA99_00620 [Gemmatimonadaceae bacterium]|nr:hypothetical protein [Gemmatimonadaceae bacterium]
MKSRTTARFRKAYEALPVHVRRQARIAYRMFRLDARHPGLHFKQVHATRPVYSARVGIGYRTLGVREGDTIIWFWIGSHADYDRLVAGL